MDSTDSNNVLTKKKRVPYYFTSDIISKLPSNILDNILSRLPIEDAARTSTLSKEWRFKWLDVTQLVLKFNDHSVRFFFKKSRKHFWVQIYQILLLHTGPLHKFSLFIPALVPTLDHFINNLILFLARKDVHEITFLNPQDTYRKKIPSTNISQCFHLRRLSLSYCVFPLPHTFTGFGKLISFELFDVDISTNDCNTLISNCPLLQELKLNELWGDHGAFVIDAPYLSFLYFNCRSWLLILKNVPVLATFIIKEYLYAYYQNLEYAQAKTSDVDIVKVFDSLPAIENFDVDMQFLNNRAGLIPDRLPTMLKHLKSVELRHLCFNNLKDVQCLLLLMRSSPNLQKLKLKTKFFIKDDPEGITNPQMHRTLSEVEEDSFNQLKEVVMGFHGIIHEFEFIKLLLAKSMVLKRITIHPKKMDMDKLQLTVQVVNEYKRASSDAEIIFLDAADDDDGADDAGDDDDDDDDAVDD